MPEGMLQPMTREEYQEWLKQRDNLVSPPPQSPPARTESEGREEKAIPKKRPKPMSSAPAVPPKSKGCGRAAEPSSYAQASSSVAAEPSAAAADIHTTQRQKRAQRNRGMMHNFRRFTKDESEARRLCMAFPARGIPFLSTHESISKRFSPA